jgi:tetratricopeptide (TPR) repeat protein
MNKNKSLKIEETFNLAVKNHQEGKTDIAQELYNQVLKIDPSHSQSLGNIAVIFISLKDYQKAKECYEKVIEIDPNYVNAHYNLGNIFNELGEFEKAKKCYKKTIEINPNYSSAHYNLISTLIKQSKFKEAELSYQKAIELIPNFNDNDIRFNSNNLHKLSRLDKAISLNPNIKNTLISSGKNLSSTNLKFSSPSPLEYEEFYRKGMGTENVGGFLRALAQMVRPNRILEIGAGYTTPFLLEALINNERVFNDGNLDEAYFKNYDYAPKLVVIDDMSLDDLMIKPGMNNLITSKYIDFIEGKFEDKADLLLNKYKNFDFVWFDCGGTTEYEIFMDQYWHLCSGYVLFHFTYSNGKPNSNHNALLDKIIGNPSIFDIVEPHKNRQGSITMINKHLSKIKKDTE